MLKHINFSFLKALTFPFIFFFQAAIVVGQQVPVMAWDKTYGGTNYEKANSIQQTSDGGCIVAGFTNSNDGDISNGNYGEADCWIVKLDVSGNKIWDKNLGGSSAEIANSIQKISDGGYIVAGYTDSDDGDVSDGNNGALDYLIIKLDSSGSKVWDKTYGGSNLDIANSIEQTSDGGYIVSGFTSSNDGDISNVTTDLLIPALWIVKLDSLGNKVWDRTFLNGSEKTNAIKTYIHQTSDGGYIIADHISEGLDYDYLIIKLDSLGNKVWDKIYGGSGHDYATSIQQTSDGNYIASGYTDSDDGDISDGNNLGFDYWIIKLNEIGDKIWGKTFGGSGSEHANSIQQTSDGGYIVAGSTYSDDGDISDGNNGNMDCWILKLDGSGNKVWDKTLGGSDADEASSIQQTYDGGYILAGMSASNDGDVTDGNNGGYGDYWILKLDLYTSYHITYQLDGATNNSENPTSYIELDSIALNLPKKTNYTFEGWFTDETFTTPITYIPKGTKGNIELWAKFVISSDVDSTQCYIMMTDFEDYVNCPSLVSPYDDFSGAYAGDSAWANSALTAGLFVNDTATGGSCNNIPAECPQPHVDGGTAYAGLHSPLSGKPTSAQEVIIGEFPTNLLANQEYEISFMGISILVRNEVLWDNYGEIDFFGIADGSSPLLNATTQSDWTTISAIPEVDHLGTSATITNRAEWNEYSFTFTPTRELDRLLLAPRGDWAYVGLDNITFKIVNCANLSDTLHSVIFQDWNNNVLKTEFVESGGSATAPSDPYRPGYTFEGWDTEFSNVTSDITITAVYQENTVGIDDLELRNTFILYPNPTNSKIILKTNALQALGEVLITDMTGKIVKQFQTQKSTTEIDVSTLGNGIYFVKAGGFSQKLVKR